MSEPEFTDKFVAFVDILGFKSLVRTAEEGRGLSVPQLSEIVRALGTEDDRKHFEKHGPTTCPMAALIDKDLNFRVTRASDSVFISAEVSPAGVINLISHCWSASFKLLREGILCRGYIKRGLVCHDADIQFGSGLSDAVEGERKVSVFKQDANERGTPFIEVGREVVEYIEDQSDNCVKEMFSRFVKFDGGLAALFPFQRLNHGFMIAGLGITFNPDEEIASLNVVRGWILDIKEQVRNHIDISDESAVRKGDHYIRMLDAQLVACDKTEEIINRLR